jgi:glycosyltransferase involved in cell wall biosynthesis
MTVLMVGPLPPPIGGISVSFRILIESLQRRQDVAIEIVDFAHIRNQNRMPFAGVWLLMHQVLKKAKSADVYSVSCSSTGLPFIGLLLLLLAKLHRKPLIIRAGGGQDYFMMGGVGGAVAHFVVKHAAVYLAQTKALVALAHTRGLANVAWFPTNRPITERNIAAPLGRKRCRRFLYIGQVRLFKGIREILTAADLFDKDIAVDVYGPIFDDLGQEVFSNGKNVTYGGVLSPDEVADLLPRYDMFLLPTQASTEGYPGAILEAFAAGLPVITTRLGGITEIVDDACGLFVEPGNAHSLYAAMKRVVDDEAFYQRLLQGVSLKRQEFDSAVWSDRFVSHCRQAASFCSALDDGDERTTLLDRQ